MRFLELLQLTGKILHGNNFLWSVMKKVISLSHAKVYAFSDSVFCLGKVNQNPTSNTVWENKLSWSKSSPQYRTLDTIDGEPMELEWNIFPGFTTLQLINKVHEFMTKMGDPSQFKGRSIFMSMFNDISWGSKDNEQECELSAQLVSTYVKKIFTRKMVILWTCIRKEVVFHSWKQTIRRMGQSCRADDVKNSAKANIQSSDPQVHCLEECSKAKVVENDQYTSALMRERLKLFFAIISVAWRSRKNDKNSRFNGQAQNWISNRICHCRLGEDRDNSTDSMRNPNKTLQKIEKYWTVWVGRTSKTIQRQACLKYSPEGLIYCSCGAFIMPSLEQKKN